MQLKFIALMLVVTTSCVVQGVENDNVDVAATTTEVVTSTLPPAHQEEQTTPSTTVPLTTTTAAAASVTEKQDVFPNKHIPAIATQNSNAIASDNASEKDENLYGKLSNFLEKSASTPNRIIENVRGKFSNKNAKILATPTTTGVEDLLPSLELVEEEEESKNSTIKNAFMKSLENGQIMEIVYLGLAVLFTVGFNNILFMVAFNYMPCLRNILAGRLITDVRRKLGGLDGDELRRLGGGGGKDKRIFG